MHLPAEFWNAVAVVSSYLSLSPLQVNDAQQPYPVPINSHDSHGHGSLSSYTGLDLSPLDVPTPIFPAPGSGNGKFECEYPKMPFWKNCSTPFDRSCWLRHPNGSRYDIVTDYENDAPIGREREYWLTITNADYNTDGITSKDMILVNGQYPGPLIEACWGDDVIVHVTNKLQWNGTAIHWHGIRQHNSMPMDGVPGITQCPIAPGHNFTYRFKALQYGSSWYHSHYSVQYANGLLGPMTIHGPTSVSWDESKATLLVSDWFHTSSFTVIHRAKEAELGFPSILINGRGDVTKFNFTSGVKYPTPDNKTFPPYELWFEEQQIRPSPKEAKKYLLRIINTSFSTTFTLSIDNHLLSIVGADFVPVLPQPVSHITVGIGQRYNVIVEARPINTGSGLPTDGNYWIRTTVASCYKLNVIAPGNYNTTGILRYNRDSKADPQTSPWFDLTNECHDMVGLVPQLPWTVAKPKNGNQLFGEGFEATFVYPDNYTDAAFPLAKWSLEALPKATGQKFMPLQINYSDPIFLHLNDKKAKGEWPDRWVVVPEDYKKEDWIYLAFAQPQVGGVKTNHPIHLHGHDFAIVQYEPNKELSPANIKLNLDNPMRRDVILLPKSGFIIIAFKADNPGSWIIHCHIAFHASEGLAMQVLERQGDANNRWPQLRNPAPEITEAISVCKEWQKFENDCTKHFPGKNETLNCYPACKGNCTVPQPAHVFMDDSGI